MKGTGLSKCTLIVADMVPRSVCRLVKYLKVLCIYEGETPHSLRGDCAVTMMLTRAARDVNDILKYVGWSSHNMPVRYSGAQESVDMTISQGQMSYVDKKGQGPTADVDSVNASLSYEALPSAYF